MTKHNFLLSLKDRLSGLPKEELEERLHFYKEMIDDRMEEGLSEEDAVHAIGSIDEIAAQILADTPFTQLVKEKTKSSKPRKVWEITLLVLGSPVWLSLLISAFAVLLSLYISLWSLIISFWAVFVSVVACTLGCMISGIIFALRFHRLTGIAFIGASFACAGLSIFLLYGCKAATNGTLQLTKKIALGLKKCFIK